MKPNFQNKLLINGTLGSRDRGCGTGAERQTGARSNHSLDKVERVQSSGGSSRVVSSAFRSRNDTRPYASDSRAVSRVKASWTRRKDSWLCGPGEQSQLCRVVFALRLGTLRLALTAR